jgi:hypothetical protein
MGKENKKIKQYGFPAKYTALVILTMLVIVVAGAGARYLRSEKSNPGQVTAQEFYFTTDLLGDSYMVDENGTPGEGNTYSFPAVQSGTYYLYGGGAHEITIKVQNFNDTERITKESIPYTAEVTVKTPEKTQENGETVSPSYEAANVTLKKDTDPFTEGTLEQKENERKQVTDTLVLNIPDNQTKPYADGTVVTVTLESKAPYVKKIQLNFVLYSVDTALRYEVKDSVGSPYAELVIMTNAVSDKSGTQPNQEVQPYLQWSQDLSIDNTNTLTYTYSDSSQDLLFNQVEGMTNRSMKISRELNPGESVSIYFFKSDTSKNYSLSRRVVSQSADGSYTITIGEVKNTTETGE